MSIQNELNKVKNAVYGSEVRGAIHDGLKKGYEKADKAELNSNEIKEKYDEVLMEWESDPNKDPEIIAARGNEPQLRNRLENVDRQLAQTVNGYINLNDYDLKGDKVSDDTAEIQKAVDDALSYGMNLYINKPNVGYRISDILRVENAENFHILIQEGTEFITSGDFPGVDVYPQSDKVPEHRAFFAFINSKNSTLTGGVYLCHEIQHPGDGRAASSVLAINSEGITVEKTQTYDLAPTGVWGGTTDTVNGVTVQIRYVAILGIKVKGMTIKENVAKNIAYSAYETRIGCKDTKFIGNYAEDCGEHLIQPTVRYGQMLITDLDESDRHNRGVIIAYNTGKGANTDITFHAQDVSCFGNTLIDVTRRGMSLRDYSDGVEIFGNTIFCTGEKGEVAFLVSGGNNFSVHDNVVHNFKKSFDGDGTPNVNIGRNTYVNVDDIDTQRNTSGIRSGLFATGIQMTALGGESGYQFGGDNATLVGFRSGREGAGHNVTAFGHESALSNTRNDLTAIGKDAGRNNTGATSTMVGKDAGRNNTGDNVLLLGRDVGIGNTHTNVVGLNASPTAPSQVQIDNRHVEMRFTPEPPSPAGGKVRYYVDNSDGTTRVFMKFSNGKKVEIANNLL